MATIDMVTFDWGKQKQVNISYPVGLGERNDRNDVMLIQTLFALYTWQDHVVRQMGLRDEDRPKINGRFDYKTQRIISAFQRTQGKRAQNADGKVHPGNYKNRIIKETRMSHKLMTITSLNMSADFALMLIDMEGGRKHMYAGNIPLAVKQLAPSIMLSPGVGFIDL